MMWGIWQQQQRQQQQKDKVNARLSLEEAQADVVQARRNYEDVRKKVFAQIAATERTMLLDLDDHDAGADTTTPAAASQQQDSCLQALAVRRQQQAIESRKETAELEKLKRANQQYELTLRTLGRYEAYYQRTVAGSKKGNSKKKKTQSISKATWSTCSPSSSSSLLLSGTPGARTRSTAARNNRRHTNSNSHSSRLPPSATNKNWWDDDFFGSEDETTPLTKTTRGYIEDDDEEEYQYSCGGSTDSDDATILTSTVANAITTAPRESTCTGDDAGSTDDADDDDGHIHNAKDADNDDSSITQSWDTDTNNDDTDKDTDEDLTHAFHNDLDNVDLSDETTAVSKKFDRNLSDPAVTFKKASPIISVLSPDCFAPSAKAAMTRDSYGQSNDVSCRSATDNDKPGFQTRQDGVLGSRGRDFNEAKSDRLLGGGQFYYSAGSNHRFQRNNPYISGGYYGSTLNSYGGYGSTHSSYAQLSSPYAPTAYGYDSSTSHSASYDSSDYASSYAKPNKIINKRELIEADDEFEWMGQVHRPTAPMSSGRGYSALTFRRGHIEMVPFYMRKELCRVQEALDNFVANPADSILFLHGAKECGKTLLVTLWAQTFATEKKLSLIYIHLGATTCDIWKIKSSGVRYAMRAPSGKVSRILDELTETYNIAILDGFENEDVSCDATTAVKKLSDNVIIVTCWNNVMRNIPKGIKLVHIDSWKLDEYLSAVENQDFMTCLNGKVSKLLVEDLEREPDLKTMEQFIRFKFFWAGGNCSNMFQRTVSELVEMLKGDCLFASWDALESTTSTHPHRLLQYFGRDNALPVSEYALSRAFKVSRDTSESLSRAANRTQYGILQEWKEKYMQLEVVKSALQQESAITTVSKQFVFRPSAEVEFRTDLDLSEMSDDDGVVIWCQSWNNQGNFDVALCSGETLLVLQLTENDVEADYIEKLRSCASFATSIYFGYVGSCPPVARLTPSHSCRLIPFSLDSLIEVSEGNSSAMPKVLEMRVDESINEDEHAWQRLKKV